jgi:hypothetical protein
VIQIGRSLDLTMALAIAAELRDELLNGEIFYSLKEA